MKSVYFHGELCIFEMNDVMPKGVKKLSPQNKHYILANSETTGNHHVLEAQDGLEVYEKDGVFYLVAETEANVSCAMKERHDTETLKPGKYFIKPALEFDHLTQTRRNVAD